MYVPLLHHPIHKQFLTVLIGPNQTGLWTIASCCQVDIGLYPASTLKNSDFFQAKDPFSEGSSFSSSGRPISDRGIFLRVGGRLPSFAEQSGGIQTTAPYCLWTLPAINYRVHLSHLLTSLPSFPCLRPHSQVPWTPYSRITSAPQKDPFPPNRIEGTPYNSHNKFFAMQWRLYFSMLLLNASVLFHKRIYIQILERRITYKWFSAKTH